MAIINGLEDLQAVFNTVDPSPYLGPKGVYIWSKRAEAQDAIEALSSTEPPFPIVILDRNDDDLGVVTRHLSGRRHRSTYHALVYLDFAIEDQNDSALDLKGAEMCWVTALGTAIQVHEDMNLCDSEFGSDSELFSYQSGHLHAGDIKEFSGIRFDIEIETSI